MGQQGLDNLGDSEEERNSNHILRGAPACSLCFVLIARFAPQVELNDGGVAHRDCFETFYFRMYGRKPVLVTNGERHHLMLAKNSLGHDLHDSCSMVASQNFHLDVQLPDILGNLGDVLIATD